jgi:EmrB/QacA subfamily drug resistance transporter
VFALVMFTTASALCGAAWNIQSLIGFSVLQGVGGGMLTPVGTAMLYRAFPPEERARASSLLTMVSVLAPAIGPVLGGFLIDSASWRWIFYVNLPIGVFGVVFASLYLREHKEKTAGRFDGWGFALAGVGLAAVVYGLAEGPQRGWLSPIVIGSLALGVVAIVVLVVVELRVAFPMLDFRLLADRSFRRDERGRCQRRYGRVPRCRPHRFAAVRPGRGRRLVLARRRCRTDDAAPPGQGRQARRIERPRGGGRRLRN